ncbi:hypothetical protein ABZP36_006176 [Zizania latifolia]
MNPNIGVVAIPDARLHVLSKFSKSQQTIPTSIELVDIADDDIVHVNGKVDPRSDIDVINLDLLFSGLEQIEKRLDKLKKSRTKDQQVKVKIPTVLTAQEQAEKSGLEKIKIVLMDRKPARSVELTDHEKEAIQHLCLLTMKPVIYVANVTESDLAEPLMATLMSKRWPN